MNAEVELRTVSKAYGDAYAVDRVSLEVARGELVALLGPSGCGKTTTLRMVAGFVEPTGGAILLRGQDVTRVPPHRRDTGMVFQSYALFPHLTVAENIAFGLKRRGVARTEIRSRVATMIGLMRLSGLEQRLPRQLSGGQQQRVAVGRALVINPAVILLDEPFSNLDAQLRESTREELRRLQQELRLTAMFVTHDQAEAMAIADRIAVMNKGRIEQIDTPAAVYHHPRTRFVAGFIGRANIFDAEVIARDPAGVAARGPAGITFVLPQGDHPGRIAVVLRPEAIRLAAGTDAHGPNTVAGVVDVVAFYGATAQLGVKLADGSRLLVEGSGDLPQRFAPGSAVVASWAASALVASAA
ncbi:MAG: ABC transporter ATP-binding protein [Alphaproteobacteria bacterium]|nr:ABC transporter ATP-binding protein [Alphaproteobacteria bacterium]